MREYVPSLMERPDPGSIVASLFYNVLASVALPFVLFLFLSGSFSNEKRLAGVEIFYHFANFLVAVCAYRSYLQDTFDDVWYEFRRLMKTVATSTGLIVLFALVLHVVFAFSENIMFLTAYGILPVAEVELFTLTSNTVAIYPFLGTLCMVLLTPVSTSCLYYATFYAPLCGKHPLLAYVLVTAFLVLPRYCNAATFWEPTQQMVLFAAQLPVHLIACWSYRKAESVWAPILTHMIVNLLSCGLILLTWVLPVL